jgi:large subunit ribosomal protein L18
MDKKLGRLRRALKTRMHIKGLGAHRLCVYKTPRHIYAQIITPAGDKILASASTLDKAFKEVGQYGGNVAAASAIGKSIAERAKAAGITEVAFDRSGFRYHGRIKALADAAREGGLAF